MKNRKKDLDLDSVTVSSPEQEMRLESKCSCRVETTPVGDPSGMHMYSMQVVLVRHVILLRPSPLLCVYTYILVLIFETVSLL